MEAPTEMVEFVNEIVAAGYHHRRGKKKKRGHYNVYTADQRARIGQYAQEHGIMPAVRKFRNEFDRPLQDSSVRSMRKAYVEARRHLPDEEVELTELPTKDRGRPLMLGEYDSEVVEYVEALKRNGVQINHQIVMDAARGVLLHHDKNKLKEFGGPIAITRKWSESFIRRVKKWTDDEPEIKRSKEEDGEVDETMQHATAVMTEDELNTQAALVAQQAAQAHLTPVAQHQQLEQQGSTAGPATIHIQHPEGTIFSMAPMNVQGHTYQQQIGEPIQTQLVNAQGMTIQQAAPGQQTAQGHEVLRSIQGLPVQHMTQLQSHMVAATPQQITQLTQLSAQPTAQAQPTQQQHHQQMQN